MRACLAAGLALPALSSATPATPEPFLYQNWQPEDGLPQVSVNAIAEDRDGYLWLGTEEGLVRFDGIDFQVFNRRNTTELTSHAIRALLVDRRGRLWIASRSALNRYENGRFTVVSPARGVALSELRALHEDRHARLWVATAAGLYRYDDGGAFTAWTSADGLAHDAVWALAEDRDGLWIGTERGLQRFADGRVVPVAAPGVLGHAPIRALRTDRRGGLWIGTDQGLFHLENGRLATYTTRDGLAHPLVNALYQDRRGHLWIGTDSGVNRLAEGVLTRMARDVILDERQVGAFWEDREGTLWIGTGAVGLVSMRRSSIVVLGAAEGLADDLVWTVYQGRGDGLWIGTNNGLSHLDPAGVVSNYTTADGLPGTDVRALLEDRRGDLWIGTDADGLARLRDGEFETFERRDGLADPHVNVIVEDAEGDLWIGTEGGLNRLADGVWSIFSVDDGLPHRSVRTLDVDPEGDLWIGTAAGLARYDGGVVHSVRLLDSPPEPFVKSLYRDPQGTLWIGTAEDGLFRLREDRLRRYSVDDGLFDSLVHEILEDDAGRLWMSSNRGIFRVDKQDLDDVAAGRREAVVSVSYSESDGMRNRECNGRGRPAGWKSDDGRLWFPTVQGVAIVDPRNLSVNEVPPAVHLEDVLVDQRPIDLEAEPHQIAPGAREFEFRFVGLSFIHPIKVRYRVRLEGFNDDWTDLGARRQASYTNLKPGDYTFRVIAANSDGVWNETGASFAFHLRAAFYQTWYFYALLVAGAAWTGRAVHLLLVRRLVRHNAELVRMKSELEAKKAEADARAGELERFTYTVSHDLKSPLFTVEGFLGLIEKDVEEGRTDRLREDFRKIRGATSTMKQLLEDLLELSRIGRVANSPEQVSLGELFDEARSLVAGQVAEKGVEIVIADDLGVVFGDRQRLLEVCQNLLENAVKYMGAQPQPRIEVTAEESGEEIVCRVRDNGMGIEPRFHDKIFGLFDKLDPESEGSGIGLALVRRIVEIHGGRVRVESEGSGKGSTFVFTLPRNTRADPLR